MIRTFIAADVYPEPELLQTFDYVRSSLKNERITWTNPCQMHITLQFLGDTEEEMISLLAERLTPAILQINPFIFQIRNLGVFNNPDNPRVLWLGCIIPEQMKELHKNVTKIVSDSGHQVDPRPFKPHLTLGRIKGISDKTVLVRLLNELGNRSIQSQRVEKIILYESRLTPQGAVYKPIQFFSLEGR